MRPDDITYTPSRDIQAISSNFDAEFVLKQLRKAKEKGAYPLWPDGPSGTAQGHGYFPTTSGTTASTPMAGAPVHVSPSKISSQDAEDILDGELVDVIWKLRADNVIDCTDAHIPEIVEALKAAIVRASVTATCQR